jgi:hypothetical protein
VRRLARYRLAFHHDVVERPLAHHMTRQSDVTHPNRSAFPPGMSGPSLRALNVAGVRSMSDVARWTKADLARLHGMGPKALDVLERALAESGRSFRRP